MRPRSATARTIGYLLAAVVVLSLLTAFGAVVIRDRKQCPPGPWAHPIDRLLRRESGFVCFFSDQVEGAA